MNERAEKVVQAAESQIGAPYVFGAWGNECTPATRRKYAGYNPSHEAAIVKGCQVLNGSRASCDGCKWQGRLCFDCRGFVHWAFLQAGVAINGAGATSQYNDAANWAVRGEISNMPDVVCAIYKHADGKMIHTGVHVGGGRINHCSAGVQTGKTTDKGWTHYAVPAGMYTAEELAEAGILNVHPVIKKGDKGAEVEELQKLLSGLGYDCGKADGVFGAVTAAALRCFQADNGLSIDAVCGSATWAALTNNQPEQEQPAQDGDKQDQKTAWDELVEQINQELKGNKEHIEHMIQMVEALDRMHKKEEE